MDRDCQDIKDKSIARMKCFIAFMLHLFFFILTISVYPCLNPPLINLPVC
jgi:hypothetical protein